MTARNAWMMLLSSLLLACSNLPVPPTPVISAPVVVEAASVPCDCSKPPVKVEPITARHIVSSWAELPHWPGDDLLGSWPAFLQSCTRLKNRAGWAAICADALNLNPKKAKTVRAFFEKYFQPHRIETSTGAQTGMITGYYEPLLKGGREFKIGRVPLYAVPDDLLTVDLTEIAPELKGLRLRARVEGKKVVPYWNRADIDNGKAKLEQKVLVWVDDAIEAFFLQVQGSGRVLLEDGTMLRIGYADQNGHPYKSIGKWLIDKGEMKLEQASMQGIQAWALAHPERLNEMLSQNPSYVFFRELLDAQGAPLTGGPIGALNVGLTDGYSIAVDPKHTPLGTPVYLSTTQPNSKKVLNRLMHAQDTGGAIRGAIRADFFWGYGNEAGALAGKMKQQGTMWILWPKELALPGNGANANGNGATP